VFAIGLAVVLAADGLEPMQRIGAVIAVAASLAPDRGGARVAAPCAEAREGRSGLIPHSP